MTAVDNYFPFDTGTGAGATPARWRLMARQWRGSGVIPGYLNQLAPSLSGGVVTINTGAMWIDGFYGENDASKTIAVSGNGQVVARMDPTARQITFVFVANQTTPTQTLTGIYEIPLMQVAGATGTDARQFASGNSSSRVGTKAIKLFGTHNTSTALTTMVWDYADWGSGVSGAYFTCPINADYFMTATLGFTSGGAGQWLHIYLCHTPVGGSVDQQAFVGTPNSAAGGLTVQAQATDIIPCNAGDLLFVQHQSNTNGINLYGGSQGYMTIRALT